MTISAHTEFFTTFRICILSRGCSTMYDADTDSGDGDRSTQETCGLLPLLSFDQIPEGLLSEACERLELLAREKATSHEVCISFCKEFDTSHHDSSSRFLSKMNSVSELQCSQKLEDLTRFLSITLSGSSAMAVEMCQNAIIKEAVFNINEKSPLLSYRRLPLFHLDDLSRESSQHVVKVNKDHLTVFSPVHSNHLHSRQVYAKMMTSNGYHSFASELSIDRLIQLLIHLGPYHLGLQSMLGEAGDIRVLLPSSLILTSNMDQLIVLERTDKPEKIGNKILADLSRIAKKVSVMSKKWAIETEDLFFILNSENAKARLVDLLFRHGCALRVFGEATKSVSKESSLAVCLYGDSMDVLENVSREMFTLICSFSSHFEVSHANYNISLSSASDFCSLLDSERINNAIIVKFSGTFSTFCHSGEPNALSINSLVCKGTKSSLLMTLSNLGTLFCQSNDFPHEMAFNSAATYQEKSSLLTSEHLNYLLLAVGPSTNVCFTYKVGTLSLDCEFISGKKDGKLSKISRGTGCQLLMDVAQGWRTDIRIVSQNLYLLVKAVEMLEGELPASLSFFVPDHHHKRIIGHGGKHIQKWMKLFGVYVKFSNNSNTNTGSTSNFIGLASSYLGSGDGRKGGGFRKNDVLFQNIRSNVLIRTPAKNAHALVQMKSAILELAGEEDQTLGIFASMHGDRKAIEAAANGFCIPSLIPEVIASNGKRVSSSFYFYIGLLRQIEPSNCNVVQQHQNHHQYLQQQQRQPMNPDLDVSLSSTKQQDLEYSHAFYIQESVEQELEASIESLFDDGLETPGSFRSSKPSLLSMENINATGVNSMNDTQSGRKGLSIAATANISTYHPATSFKFPAISRPLLTTAANTTNTNIIATRAFNTTTIFSHSLYAVIPSDRESDDNDKDYFYWDSLLGFGRRALPLDPIASLPSTPISSSPIRPVQ